MSFRPLSLLGFVFGALAGLGPRIGEAHDEITADAYVDRSDRRVRSHASHTPSGAAAAKRASRRRRNIEKHPRGAR